MNRPESTTRLRGALSPWMLISLSLLAAIVITVILRSGFPDSSQPAPDVVSRVNGKDIGAAELRRVRADLIELSQQQLRAGGELPSDEELDAMAVRQLIERELMLQEAARRQLSVSDDEIFAALSELRERFPDLENMAAWMRERGLTDPTLIEAIREDILARRLQAALVMEIAVTEQQMRDFYDAQNDGVAIGEQVRLGIIVVESLEVGDEVMTALANGESFNRLGQARSVAPGGDTGWIDPASLPLPLRRAVAGLKEGEIFGPLQKENDEFVIVALAGRRPIVANNFEEAQETIEQHLLSAYRQRAVANWLAEQKANAQIEVFPIVTAASEVATSIQRD